MLQTFEVLVVDLFFVLLVSLFTEMTIDRRNFSKNQRLLLYTFTYSLALFINLIISADINGQYRVDLRHVVFVMAGLYGGLLCLPILLIMTIFFVGIMYPFEAYANLLTLAVEVTVIGYMANHYHKWRLRKKLIYLGTASFTAGSVIMYTVDYFFGFSTGYDYVIIAVYTGSLLLLIFLTEWVRNSIAINRRIQRAEKLELVSHLAASISHEVRNPLTVTRGFLQILESDDFPPDKRREFFSLAKSELDRAEGIIRDYLTFAKPFPGKIEHIQLKDELQHMLEVILPLANMHSVSISTNLTDAHILGEKQLFQQCILNILKNGIESMEKDGGTLTISTQLEEGYIEITITDNGIGMTADQIERLGEPYFSTRGKNGTGLGMMVVYSIIQSMNGKISVESTPRYGTTFHLFFPAAHQK